MSSDRPGELSQPEASVLGDALRHGVVKVCVWRLPDRRDVGRERLEAAISLSRRGLLHPSGERLGGGPLKRNEEDVPTPRGRLWTLRLYA